MKVFVNDVDLFTGRLVAKLLASSVVGGTNNEGEEEGEEEVGNATEKAKYTIVGSLSSSDAVKPPFVDGIVSNEDRNALFQELLGCDVIVYDISHSQDQAREAEDSITRLREGMESWDGKKTFICLSSVLTWANTKPIDPDDAEAMFQEGDYRKRRSHKRYKQQIDTEKVVYKCGKKTNGKLNVFIINSGITYGEGEDTFHLLFKQAWELKVDALPIYGSAESFIPTIHITDLANIVLHALEGHAQGMKYILAVDEAQSSLAEITKALATQMGNSKTKLVDVDEAFLMEGVSQVAVDMLTIDLKMEMGCAADMPFDWIAREGFVETLPKVIGQYKRARHLEALKLCVYGPPASGKSSLCELLAKEYKLLHIDTEYVTTHTMELMRENIALLDNNEDDDFDTEQAESDKELLGEIEQAHRETGQYENEHLLALFKRQLNSMQCKNHGFIIDSYPIDEETARQLFEPPEQEEEGEEEDDEDEDASLLSKMPQFVFTLDIEDDHLRERVQEMTEKESKYSQGEFEGLLAKYHEENTEDNTILNFFDFYDILPKHLDAMANNATELCALCMDVIGSPHNYGPTKEEREEMEKLAREMKEKADLEEARRRAAEDAIEEAQRQGAQAVWDARLSEIKAQEQEALDQAALPLRTFLMNHIMPTLTKGLMEVCKVKPEDPVDYLAEYLFKNNPQIE
eukprot:m.22581 g.22581  ORF g.22581 m.22581 type:complete len:688 (-) comp8864_c0_seq1:104-2167(-)